MPSSLSVQQCKKRKKMLEDEGTTFLRKAGDHMPNDRASHPATPDSLTTLI
jgi:hypothetical protein